MAGVSINLTGDWGRAKQLFKRVKGGELRKAFAFALHKEAVLLSGHVKEYLADSSHFADNSPLTIASRQLAGFGGTKPMNVSGALKGAVTVEPNDVGSLQKFVGVLRTARGKDGRDLFNIGSILEEGRTFVIHMTPKMRRFLFGVLFPKAGIDTSGPPKGGSSGVVSIHIPARPFLRPVFDKWGPTSGQRVLATMSAKLGGDLGTP